MQLSKTRILGKKAFTLVESLLVVSLVGILAAIGIESYSDSSSSTRIIVARQQQVVIQSALDAYISTETNIARNGKSIKGLRDEYNGLSRLQRFQKLERYMEIPPENDDNKWLDGTKGMQNGFLREANAFIDLPPWAFETDSSGDKFKHAICTLITDDD